MTAQSTRTSRPYSNGGMRKPAGSMGWSMRRRFAMLRPTRHLMTISRGGRFPCEMKTSQFAIVLVGVGMLAFQPRSGSPAADLDTSHSPMRPYIESFNVDRIALLRYYNIELAADR